MIFPSFYNLFYWILKQFQQCNVSVLSYFITFDYEVNDKPFQRRLFLTFETDQFLYLAMWDFLILH